MKTIAILGTANVAGAVRYAIEGSIPVRDDAEAKRLVDLGLAEYVDEEDADDDGLDDHKVDDLKKIAADEKVDLGDATKKADIVAAIRARRTAAGE